MPPRINPRYDTVGKSYRYCNTGFPPCACRGRKSGTSKYTAQKHMGKPRWSAVEQKNCSCSWSWLIIVSCTWLVEDGESKRLGGKC
jgi:hypothetical protein